MLKNFVLGALLLAGCSTMDKNVISQHQKGGKELKNMRVAILVADGFEQVEMTKPRQALAEAGAETVLISPKGGEVQGYNHDKIADSFKVELTLDNAHAKNFDALLLPGGVQNPDSLRLVPEAIAFIKKMGDAKKPIAAICHGPWTLINAGLVKNVTLTSWPSLKTDLNNAGAHWVDREVVVDKNIVTSRKPEDIPAFNEAMIKLFAKSKH